MFISTPSACNLFETDQGETKEMKKTKSNNNEKVILNNEIAHVQLKCGDLAQACEMLEK